MTTPNILIVDDTTLNRKILALALLPAGYHIIEAGDGREAVAKIMAHDVDLVLLDLMMPVMDGFEFLEWRQGNEAYKSIPVIVNSALDDFASIRKALTMDSYDYFTKPLTEQDLKVILPLKVKNAIQSKRLYSELKSRNERMEKEIELAGAYQRSLLPSDLDLPLVRVVTFYRPYIGVAGDFFDVVDLGDAVAFFIADVSGHGLLSAMVSSQLKMLFHRYISQTRSPKETCVNLNQDLLRLTREEDYVTAFCGLYEPGKGRLVYVNAGHPDQFLMDGRGRTLERMSSGGIFLGIFDQDSPLFEQSEMAVEAAPGDRLLIFTDGSVEAFSPTEPRQAFGYQRWEAAFDESMGLDLKPAAEVLWQRIMEHTQGQLQDDVAFVLAQFRRGDGS